MCVPDFIRADRWGLCQCGCHVQAYDDDPYSGLPPAEEKGLCMKCADESSQPWPTILEALARG